MARASWAAVILLGFGALGCVTGAAAPAFPPSPTDASFYVARGVEQARARQWAAAIASFERALALAPEDRDARYNLALALYNSGKYQQAVREFQRVLAGEATALDARKGLGLALLGLRRWGEAAQVLSTVLKSVPNDPTCLVALGRAYLGAGNPRKAAVPLRQLVSLRPNDAGAHYDLGRALAAMGDHEGAEQAFGTALRLKPASEAAAVGLAKAQIANKRFALATQTLKPFVEKQPPGREVLSTLAEAYDGLELVEEALQTRSKLAALLPPGQSAALRIQVGNAYLRRLRWTEAAVQFNVAAASSPSDPEPHIGLARCYEGLGRTPEEVEEWRTAARLAPTRPGIWVRLSEALQKAGKPREALEALDMAISVAPQDQTYLRLAADLARSLGDLVLVEMYLRRILALNPRDWASRVAVVDVLLERGQAVKALIEAGEALRAPEPPAEAHMKVAYLAERVGNLQLAISQWRTLMGKGSRYEEPAAVQLGRILVRAHRVSEAVEMYRRELAKKPGSAELALGLARAYQAIGEDQAAVEVLRGLLAERADLVEARAALAESLSWLGQAEEARQEMERVLATGPLSEAACRSLVTVYERSGRPEEAAAMLEGLIPTAVPETVGIELVMRLYRQSGQLEMGGHRLAELFDAHPTHPKLGLAAAQLLGEAGKLIEAEQLLRGMAQRREWQEMALRQLAVMYADSAQPERALEPLRRLLEADENAVSVIVMLAEIEPRPEMVAQAKEIIARMARAARGSPAFWAAAGELAQILGRVTVQLPRLEALAAGRAPDPGIATGIATLALLDGQPLRAEKAIAAVPDDAREDRTLLQVLARAQVALGKTENAMSSLRRAIQTGDAQAEDHLLLASLLRQAGKTEEGLWHLVEALRLDPADVSVRQAILEVIAANQLPALTIMQGIKHVYFHHPDTPVVFELVEALSQRPDARPMCEHWLRRHPRPTTQSGSAAVGAAGRAEDNAAGMPPGGGE